MPHLVAAPDKFRGTASAHEAAAAMVQAAGRLGWSGTAIPMSDGGEGLLDVVAGEDRSTAVSGPLGAPVEARWRLLSATADQPQTAVIEMATAAGRALLPHPADDDPLRANTVGVGQLLLAAREAGAQRIVIGCGGSATTDGGWGALSVAGAAETWADIELVVACDVTTQFAEAARVFGPQKGATPAQVHKLSTRLRDLADHYQRVFGVTVHGVAGAGAGGGLAGGLTVLGARIVPGFGLVAELNGLETQVTRADLVVTGEGHLDPPSFDGKVPGALLDMVGGRCPVLCLVGGADDHLLRQPPPGMEIVSLIDRFGAARARNDTIACIGEATTSAIERFGL
ncbi:MAG TPA: glycerate kinase [Acidimicrobiales bacterium]|jgi:glycerate kinase|nr:glycerate kinase [Acidimicrobiales bacterium]